MEIQAIAGTASTPLLIASNSKMMSTSREPSNSDADPEEVRNSYSIVLHPASDLSKTILDPLLHETKLAHEELAAVNEPEYDALGRQFISYEEAVEREMEYQKKIKTLMSQHQVGSMSHPMASQELPPIASSVGLKRKAICVELEPASGHSQQSLVQYSINQKPLPPGPSSRQPLAPPRQYSQGQPVQQKLNDHQPLPHRPLNPQSPSFKELPPVPSFRGTSNPPESYQQNQQPLQIQRPPTQHSENQNPFANNQHPSFGGSSLPPDNHQQFQQPPTQYPPAHQNHPGGNRHRPFPHQPHHRHRQGQNYQENPVWCNLCKVKCVTHHNLKIHCQGRKHKNMKNELRSKMHSSSNN